MRTNISSTIKNKMTPELSPAEIELLALLSEELGEAIQAVGKILRHGYDSRNPHLVTAVYNRQKLEMELGDIAAAVDLLVESHALSAWRIKAAKDYKAGVVFTYLHHNKGLRDDI